MFPRKSPLDLCMLPSKATGFGNASKGCLWTCDEMAYFCTRDVASRQFWLYWGIAFQNIQVNYLAAPGIVSNLLLFLTLLSPRLKGTTFIFLRVISFAQIFQGVLA